jgi:hypothetical protein
MLTSTRSPSSSTSFGDFLVMCASAWLWHDIPVQNRTTLFKQLRTCGRPLIIIHFILATRILITDDSMLSARSVCGTKCGTSLFGCGTGKSEFYLRCEQEQNIRGLGWSSVVSLSSSDSTQIVVSMLCLHVNVGVEPMMPTEASPLATDVVSWARCA